jgi:8-oxo-dGTP pyrophosphatase MutT (NUDIX family)
MYICYTRLMAELLDIVNEHDQVIGQIERDDANKAKHIFRMVFIGFYTPDKHIILQLRSLAKKNNPGKLTATVSGHVQSGQSYDVTALKEGYEESGITINPANLKSLGVMFGGDAMRAMYAYPFDGTTEDLKVEEGEGAGFVAMSIPALRKERNENPDKFTPFILGEAGTALIEYIEGM